MASFTPTITINSTPGLEVNMAGSISYNEFINSLGQYIQNIQQIHIQTQTIAQILQPISYNIQDANGNQFSEAIILNVDPYQMTTSLIQPLKNRGIVLNGQSSLSFNVMPNEFITMILCTDQYSINDGLDKFGKPNKKRIEDPIGNFKLYEEFKTCL